MKLISWFIKLFINRNYKTPMLNVILFGPPGSGKGTQAALLVERYGLLHISTGDLFRHEMSNNTPLGLQAKEYMAKGQLVPDEVTIGMLKNKVNAHPEAKGIIFDGFPRNIFQASELDKFLNEKSTEVSILLSLDVPDDEIVTRILNRGISSGRADDNDESIIRKRIEVYRNETSPVFEYYAKSGKSKLIDGLGSVEEILDRLCFELDKV
jgi:adenylate kinase